MGLCAPPPELTIPQAITELRHGAGTQFDPTIVHAIAELTAAELGWLYPAGASRPG